MSINEFKQHITLEPCYDDGREEDFGLILDTLAKQLKEAIITKNKPLEATVIISMRLIEYQLADLGEP